MKVSFEGIGEKAATFEAQETGEAKVRPGEAVTLCGNGRVCACTSAGDVPVGVALSLRGGYAAVQTGGYVKLPCAAELTAGFHRVSMTGEGKLTADPNGREAVVVDVDVSAGLCGVIL